jgi:hypothetical protein
MALAEGLAKAIVLLEQQLDQAASRPVIACGIEPVKPLADQGPDLLELLVLDPAHELARPFPDCGCGLLRRLLERLALRGREDAERRAARELAERLRRQPQARAPRPRKR